MKIGRKEDGHEMSELKQERNEKRRKKECDKR